MKVKPPETILNGYSVLFRHNENSRYVYFCENLSISTCKNIMLGQNLFLPFYLLIFPHHISSQILLPLSKKYIPLHGFYFHLFTLLEPIVNNCIIHLLLFLLIFTTSIDQKDQQHPHL